MSTKTNYLDVAEDKLRAIMDGAPADLIEEVVENFREVTRESFKNGISAGFKRAKSGRKPPRDESRKEAMQTA